MAVGIYVGSTEAYSGKSVVAMGLGLMFQRLGLRVGFMRPLGMAPRMMDEGAHDADARFVLDVLGLDDDPHLVTPVLVNSDFKIETLAGENPDLAPRVREAFEVLSRNRDVMLVAGAGGMHKGRFCGLDGVTVAKVLKLHTVVVDRMKGELNYDFTLFLKEALGEQLAGLIFNDIPLSSMDEVKNVIAPFLETKGIKPLGVIPRDANLGGVKVGDLAERLDGRIVSAAHKADVVVENFLIGTMQVENFLTHFRRHRNSVIIVGGDRADLQLVALEGNCPCLMLTGNLYPSDIILTRSESMGIPVVLVPEDTYSVARKVEIMLARHKMRDKLRIKQGAQVLSASIDFEYLKRRVGL